MTTPRLTWEMGSAYDFFISLWVLHRPNQFGLRASWAAGVRSRLPQEHRDTLDEIQAIFFPIPMHWLHHLPDEKTAQSALDELKALPSDERLPALFFSPNLEADIKNLLLTAPVSREWTDAEKALFHNSSRPVFRQLNQQQLDRLQLIWARHEQVADALLLALQAYHDNFFFEEEIRIMPALQEGLDHARRLAEKLPITTLLEELSAGVQWDWVGSRDEIILVPSFWSTPFVFYDTVSPACELIIFGARPEDCSLVPGEMVPDALFNGLKAVADTTRLRILRELMQQPQTPTALARTLRLRTPTVIHHLTALRLAELVQIKVLADGERCYAARSEGVAALCSLLNKFLQGDVL